jgi:hypothetical protein
MVAWVGRVAGFVLAAGVLTGCQSVPADFKPDPALKAATPAKLQSHVADLCVKSQRAKASVETSQVAKPCGCYARGALKAMDKTEIEYFRANGFFADSARPKAQAALNACGLK